MAWSIYNAQGVQQVSTVATLSVMTMVNVKDYGAVGDGSTNDSTAINNAIAAAGALGVSNRGVDVYFPAGVYAHASTIVNNNNNVMLRGSGWQSTVLYCTASTGDNVQLGNGSSKSGCGIMNMSVWSSGAKTSGANINVNAMNDCLIQNFVINNCYQGILVQGASIKVWIDQGEINNSAATGVGIQVTNGAAGDTYIRGIVMSNAANPVAGIQVTQSGHFEIINCNVTKATIGLNINPTGTQLVTYGFIEHTLFDSCVTNALNIQPSGASTAKVQSLTFVDSWFSGTTAAGNGIVMSVASSSVCDGVVFVGCRVLNNYQIGVNIGAGPNNITLQSCTIAGNGQNTSNTYDGISIAANASNLKIRGNEIGQSGTAANQQRYAISIAAGTSSNIEIIGNDCEPNGTVGTQGYINIGTLTGGGNIIKDNQPCVYAGDGSASVAASSAINTTETVISSPKRYLANAIYAGTTWHFRVAGTCTTTAANVSTFRVRLGTAGTTSDTAIMTFATTVAGTTGATDPFTAEITVTCRTVGGSATFYGHMRISGHDSLGIIAVGNDVILGTAASGVTTNANYITLTYVSAATTTTSTFQQVAMTTYTTGNNN